MTAIIDYKAGNLTSVKYAMDALGEESIVTSDPAEIAAAGRVIFPGVGAAKSAMANLRSLGLEEVVRSAAAHKPFLGICLGMQILFERTEEDGGVELLGILPGGVRRFPEAAGCKIPHMGWNSVEFVPRDSCLVPGDENTLGGSGGSAPRPLPATRHESRGTNHEYYYFVHSYCAPVGEFTTGITEYAGIKFSAIVQRGNILACQFHPEKSGSAGLALLKSWLDSRP